MTAEKPEGDVALRPAQGEARGCPHCSFDPSSLGDFCDKHRTIEVTREDYTALSAAHESQATRIAELERVIRDFIDCVPGSEDAARRALGQGEAK